MYPRLSDIFPDLFGFELPLPLYSFGLMVAAAILTAAWLARRELDRKYAAGVVGGVEVEEETGKGRKRKTVASPSALMPTIVVLAAVFGVLGSKVFHILENLGDFLLDPGRYLLSADGLTIYGGIIVAGLAIAYYVRRRGLRVGPVADSIAPGLMLGYGIGRIGCYLSGDGDWGVCSDLADKPAFVPAFLWSETFPRNILGRDLLAQCGAPYDGVYPTMLYEVAMATALAGVLWALRKHPFQAGWLFSLYLVFNGVERFLIEQIRVNVVMFELGGWGVTQAMLIAVGFVVVGCVGLALLSKRRAPVAPEPVVMEAQA